jgi:hypothetical protein
MEMDEEAAAGVALDVKVILTPPPKYFNRSEAKPDFYAKILVA